MAPLAPREVVPIPIPGIPPLPLPSNPFSGGPHNPLAAFTESEKLFAKLLDPHTYVRFGEVGIGVVLVAIGIFAALKGPQRVESAARTVNRTTNVISPGKAAATRAGKVATARESARTAGVEHRAALRRARSPQITRK